MILDSIRANADVVKALSGMVDSGRVPHALMLYENDGCGAMLLAQGFLERLTGSQKVAKMIHPDIHYVFPVTKGTKVKTDKPTSESYMNYWRELVLGHPYFLESDVDEALGIEGKSSVIAVSEAHTIIEKLSLGALEGGYRAVVIYLPEKMNTETANRLLKSIEEPPQKTQFVLITHAPEKVLTTISSRCLCVRVAPMSREDVGAVLCERYGRSDADAQAAAATAGGSVGRALLALSESEAAVSEADLFLRLMRAMLDRDLVKSLEVGDELAALPSREKARSFCRYCGEALRKIFMLQKDLDVIAGVGSREEWDFRELAGRLKPTFVRRALPCLDDSVSMITRNVSQKIVFCDLVDRLFLMI